MTMVVGMNLGEYVIIASDKRATKQVNGTITHVISDKVDKLLSWSGGAITGNGYAPLLEHFKAQMDFNIVHSVDDILRLVLNSLSEFKGVHENWINQSNWMFNFIGEEHGKRVHRLAYISAKEPENIRALYPMTAQIWAKIPDPKEKIDELTSKLKPLRNFLNLEESIVYHLKLLIELFEYAASVDDSVCVEYDYYVKTFDDEIFSQNLEK